MLNLTPWLPMAVGIPSAIWLYLVNTRVPDPYLDEVFHVRQAQAYLNHQWHTWDPKITTPPGLYLLSYVWMYLCRLVPYVNLIGSAADLRLIHPTFVVPVLGTTLSCVSAFLGHDSKVRGHLVLNVLIFPLLFFFSGLYYTDVVSARMVIKSYEAFLEKKPLKVFFCGVIALWFRQTNVFWVAIFLGGLEVVRTFSSDRSAANELSFTDTLFRSYKEGEVDNKPIYDAGIEDYLVSGSSVLAATLGNPKEVIVALRPYIALLILFLGFLVWNGGVVLGDKENHIASLHLAQMLYIWPLFVFFSWPLLYQRVLSVATSYLILPHDTIRVTRSSKLIKNLFTAIATMTIMALIVHFNTVVHPFTLADNRHYMFYVFRILLRHPAIKYAVIPIYYFSAILCISALNRPPNDEAPSGGQTKPSPSLTKGNGKPKESEPHGTMSSEAQPGKEGNGTAFALVFLISTSLSLVTAPLVEPRYFIVPWLIWRLHLPSSFLSSTKTVSPRVSNAPSSSTPRNRSPATMTDPEQKGLHPSSSSRIKETNNRFKSAMTYFLSDPSAPILIETIWFAVINLTTCYIFLQWGFEWPQEPGKLQRFLW